jgi:peroxiredoxin
MHRKMSISSLAGLVMFILMISQVDAGPIKKVENFKLKDYNGKEHSLSDYKNSKAIVLIFVATDCPVSNAYNSRMAELYNEYKEKDVAIIGINSNKAEGVSDIKEHAGKNNLDFPILKDEGNKIADKLGATVTPEVYLLNNEFEILYHGRIDDSRDISEVSEKDLSNALNEVLSGKKVSKASTKAFGCTIKKISS